MVVRRLALLALPLVACGGGARKGADFPDQPDPLPEPNAETVARQGEPAAAAGRDTPVSANAVCARIFELKASHCPLVDSYELTADECVTDYTRSLEERGADARQATIAAGHCLLDQRSCEAATACFEEMTSGANNGAPDEYRACDQTELYAPVGVTKAAWARRKGAGLVHYGEARSSKDDPVAVCGIPAEMDWLMSLTCDDGSHPFANRDQAHAARVGNVGPGGSCGSIIDLYEVPCPEGTHAIYMDAYVCPLPD